MDKTAERQALQHMPFASARQPATPTYFTIFMLFVALIMRSGEREGSTFHEGCSNDDKLACRLHDDLHDYQPTRTLWSSTAHLLQRPLVLTSVDSRAFTVAASTVWNSLSVNTPSAEC